MRGRKGRRHPLGHRYGVGDAHPLRRDHAGKNLARDELHGDEIHAIGRIGFVHNHDVGMVERGGGASFPHQARAQGGVIAACGLEHLKGHQAIELHIARLVDDAHPACADLFQHLEMADLLAGGQHMVNLPGIPSACRQ